MPNEAIDDIFSALQHHRPLSNRFSDCWKGHWSAATGMGYTVDVVFVTAIYMLVCMEILNAIYSFFCHNENVFVSAVICITSKYHRIWIMGKIVSEKTMTMIVLISPCSILFSYRVVLQRIFNPMFQMIGDQAHAEKFDVKLLASLPFDSESVYSNWFQVTFEIIHFIESTNYMASNFISMNRRLHSVLHWAPSIHYLFRGGWASFCHKNINNSNLWTIKRFTF